MGRRILSSVIFFSSLWPSTLAAEWDCHPKLSLHDYDLTSLGLQTIERTRDSPPSQMLDRVTFDLCKPIQEESHDLPESDKARPVNAARQYLDSHNSSSAPQGHMRV
jgi:hypothetical protein